MAAPIRMTWNTQGMNALMVSREMSAMCRQYAELGKAFARTISPRSKKQHKHYASSFVVLKTTINDARGGKRAGAILANRADHAGAVEWGVEVVGRKPTQGHNVLSRTVSHLEGLG